MLIIPDVFINVCHCLHALFKSTDIILIVFTCVGSVVSNPNGSNISSAGCGPVNMKRADASQNQVSAAQVPDISYSSSEDEDFYDAEEYRYGSPKTTSE